MPKKRNKMYAKITDIAVYIPEIIVSNDELENIYPEWSSEKIFEKTGIRERRVSIFKQTAGDMAIQAGQKILDKNDFNADKIEYIILCTQSPDYFLPTTACLIQDRLGIPRSAGAVDVNLGCSGYIYGLSLAKGLIESGIVNNVLLLTSDTYSKYIHPMDKSTRTIFGDAATASLIVGVENDSEFIGPFVFGTDGSGASNLIVEAGASRLPKSGITSIEFIDDSGNIRSQENLVMNGPEMMSFTLKVVPDLVSEVLNKSSSNSDEVDYYIFHQANKFILNTLRKKLKITENQMPIEIEYTGNTVSSSIPMVLDVMNRDGRLNKSKKLLLVGFGVGYSWAGCLVKCM